MSCLSTILRRIPSLLPISIALSSAATIAAPAPSILGESATLRWTLATSTRFDNNLFLSSSFPRSDTVVSIAPGMSMNWGDGPSAHVGVTAQEAFVRYLHGSVEDDNLGSVQFSGHVAGSRTQLNLAAGFEQLRGNTRDLRGQPDLARRDQTSATLGVARELGPRTMLRTGLDFVRDAFAGDAFRSTRQTSWPVTLSYAATPKLNLNASHRFQEVRFGDVGTNFSDHVLGFGVNGELTPKLSGHADVNVTRHDRGDGAVDTTLGLDVSLSWAATVRMGWTAGIARDFQPSPATGSAYSSTRLDLQNGWALTEFWSTQATIQGEFADYGTGQRDQLLTATFAVNYAPAGGAIFSAACQREHNRSNTPLGDYDRTALSISATFFY